MRLRASSSERARARLSAPFGPRTRARTRRPFQTSRNESETNRFIASSWGGATAPTARRGQSPRQRRSFKERKFARCGSQRLFTTPKKRMRLIEGGSGMLPPRAMVPSHLLQLGALHLQGLIPAMPAAATAHQRTSGAWPPVKPQKCPEPPRRRRHLPATPSAARWHATSPPHAHHPHRLPLSLLQPGRWDAGQPTRQFAC